MLGAPSRGPRGWGGWENAVSASVCPRRREREGLLGFASVWSTLYKEETEVRREADSCSGSRSRWVVNLGLLRSFKPTSHGLVSPTLPQEPPVPETLGGPGSIPQREGLLCPSSSLAWEQVQQLRPPPTAGKRCHRLRPHRREWQG